MKRLNLKSQVTEDDEKLISLLKTSIGLEPPEQFVENTLEKFLTLKTSQEKAHKPLRFPLYIMSVIGLILLAPMFFTGSSQISLPILGFELENLTENISFKMDSWYTVSLLLLASVSLVLVRVQLGLDKFRNPFV